MKEKKQEKNKVKKERGKKVGKPKEKVEPINNQKKNQDKESKLIKKVIIICGIVLVLVLFSYAFYNSLRFHNYKGVEFETVNYGELILQQTSIPVIYQGSEVPYNFYLRTPIPKLKKVPFKNLENFYLMKISGFRLDSTFDCDGDQTIALANLANLHTQMGIQFVQDQNATCDERYNLFILKEGNKTEINEIQPNCYEVLINNCEILPATEKIMLEMFVRYQEFIS